MKYTSRNLFYLKVNTHTVLPVFLHLDEQAGHTEWIDDAIVRAVVEDMRFLIGPKIRAEDEAAASKKSSGVDVHRGPNYQFGYYLQKADYHHVLIKHKSFVPAPPPDAQKQSVSSVPDPPPPLDTSATSNRRKQRQVPQTQQSGKKRRRHRGSQSDIDDVELSDRENDRDTDVPSFESSVPRRSARVKRVVHGTYREGNPDDEVEQDDDPPIDGDTDMNDGTPVAQVKKEPNENNDNATREASAPHIDLSAQLSSDEEDKQAKLKMKMKLTYEGFTISKYKLCLIVQPYPVLPRPSKASELGRSESLLPARQGSILQYTTSGRESSNGPPPSSPSIRDARSMTPAYQQTPLFREPTPALSEQAESRDLASHQHSAVSRSDEGDTLAIFGDDTLDGLMQLTQSFHERGDNGLGIGGHDAVDFDADEDDVLGGDADE